jgi:hypothetical protein
MSEPISKLTIGIDFDGTICAHGYPQIGMEVPGAIGVILELQRAGHRLILWTMRSGKELEEAVKYCKTFGIEFYGINENPQQHTWTESKKAFCHMYIDDAALGCPLYGSLIGRPFVNWHRVRELLVDAGVLSNEVSKS